MTNDLLFKNACDLLKSKGIENYSNEARWIFESVFENGRELLIFSKNSEANAAKEAEFNSKVLERASGRPLQYVLGSWDFYGETFLVGEGVLTPRPETELLVDFALDYLKDKNAPVVFDLCAGSGCIGLTVALNMKNAQVYLLEKSDAAFAYLKSNKAKLGCDNATLVSGDLFSGFESFGLPKPDLMLSNPPYIESAVIPLLQREVQMEPHLALDGGEDGYDFYKALAAVWLPHCKGAVAVECGEGQAHVIAAMFSGVCARTGIIKDFNSIDRAVYGYISERK